MFKEKLLPNLFRSSIFAKLTKKKENKLSNSIPKKHSIQRFSTSIKSSPIKLLIQPKLTKFQNHTKPFVSISNQTIEFKRKHSRS